MFTQWKPVLTFLRPCLSVNIGESSSRHLQFLGQLLNDLSLNLSVASTPPFLFRGQTGVTSLPLPCRFCRHMELQDDVLQPQHQLLFGDGDTVVELALRAELPQKGLRLASRNQAVMISWQRWP